MKRHRFIPPTDYYDERVAPIDEELCRLIRQRKDQAAGSSGFPSPGYIGEWAETYGFYPDFLNSIFAHLLNEEAYRPVVEPKGFVGNLPVMKSFEKGESFFSVPFIRQFENASVVHFHMDRVLPDEAAGPHEREHTFFNLEVQSEGREYDCRNDGGSGSQGHFAYTYVVSPALPEDGSGYRLIFREVETPYQKPTGFEVEL
ncbi:hypothetical protein [Indiicoccus explosivorum]|uniref:hypothetical protein n=1 Tax=Indiicoccus explosivorum TaxID=1917864 RepID=UPI001F4E3CB9|nr:hypothetical protein [Indiicoccus explosivorum]